ncbi:MAG: THUMP domain-containing protein [Ignisphaera sp.]
MDFNVIITYEPGEDNSNWVFSQLNSCVGASYIVAKVRSSVILLSVQDPYSFWHSIKICLQGKDTPIHRVIPIDVVVDPLLNKVVKIATEYALRRIPENETYRVTLHGRLYTVDERGRLVKVPSLDAVRAIAQDINRKVNLKNPQWVVYVRSLSVQRWRTVVAISVARAFVFKNIRFNEVGYPI